MPLYHVTVPEIWHRTTAIAADSEEEARDLVLGGNGDEVDVTYHHTEGGVLAVEKVENSERTEVELMLPLYFKMRESSATHVAIVKITKELLETIRARAKTFQTLHKEDPDMAQLEAVCEIATGQTYDGYELQGPGIWLAAGRSTERELVPQEHGSMMINSEAVAFSYQAYNQFVFTDTVPFEDLSRVEELMAGRISAQKLANMSSFQVFCDTEEGLLQEIVRHDNETE